jgi:hypothetical protein
MVAVRPHPADDIGYWDRWRNVEGVEILEDHSSFMQFLEDVRPRFVASSYSTALLDALLRGIVPITISDDDQFLDIVFPIQEIAVSWFKESELAQLMLDDADARTAFILDKLKHVRGRDYTLTSDDQAVSAL